MMENGDKSQDDASYTVGVALYDAAGQRLCDGTTGQRAPQAATDWWLQVPLQGCPLLPLGWRITTHNWWYVSMVFRCFHSRRFFKCHKVSTHQMIDVDFRVVFVFVGLG